MSPVLSVINVASSLIPISGPTTPSDPGSFFVRKFTGILGTAASAIRGIGGCHYNKDTGLIYSVGTVINNSVGYAFTSVLDGYDGSEIDLITEKHSSSDIPTTYLNKFTLFYSISSTRGYPRKLNSAASGSRYLSTSMLSNASPSKSTTLSTGETYCVGSVSAAVTTYTLLKLNDTLSSIVSRQNSSLFLSDVKSDSSDDVYVLASTAYSTQQPNYCILGKITAVNGVAWYRKISDVVFGSLVIDRSGNIVVACTDTNTKVRTLLKFNNTGSLIWKISLPLVTPNVMNDTSVDVDENNNIYLICRDQPSLCLFKVDATGQVIYTRKFTNLAANYPYLTHGIISVNNGAFILQVLKNTSVLNVSEALLFKLPTDGSYLGTYGGVEYSSITSVPYASPSVVTTVGTFLTSNTTTTVSAATFTQSSGNIQSSLIAVP